MLAMKIHEPVELMPPPDAFRALIRDLASRLEAGDTAGLAHAFYAEGARLVPPDPYPVTGRDPIQRYWQSMVDEGLREATLEATGVECVRGAAYVLGRYELAGGGSAPAPFRESGLCVILFRRQRDGSWKAAEQVFLRD